MPLGTDVGLGPDDIVFDGDPAPPAKKGHSRPIFGRSLLWRNGCMYHDTTWYGGRPQPRRYCVTWGPSSPFPKGGQPPIFGQCPLWPNGWMDEDSTLYGSRLWPRPHCVRQGPSSPVREVQQPSSVRPMSIVATVAHLSYC